MRKAHTSSILGHIAIYLDSEKSQAYDKALRSADAKVLRVSLEKKTLHQPSIRYDCRTD